MTVTGCPEPKAVEIGVGGEPAARSRRMWNRELAGNRLTGMEIIWKNYGALP